MVSILHPKPSVSSKTLVVIGPQESITTIKLVSGAGISSKHVKNPPFIVGQEAIIISQHCSESKSIINIAPAEVPLESVTVSSMVNVPVVAL
jgi:hypothetical protein